jgi:hypothetical protein
MKQGRKKKKQRKEHGQRLKSIPSLKRNNQRLMLDRGLMIRACFIRAMA